MVIVITELDNYMVYFGMQNHGFRGSTHKYMTAHLHILVQALQEKVAGINMVPNIFHIKNKFYA